MVPQCHTTHSAISPIDGQKKRRLQEVPNRRHGKTVRSAEKTTKLIDILIEAQQKSNGFGVFEGTSGRVARYCGCAGAAAGAAGCVICALCFAEALALCLLVFLLCRVCLL